MTMSWTSTLSLDWPIKDAETGHPIPYVDVRTDVTCDGWAVYRDVPLLLVARPRRGIAGFPYGNNVELVPVGSYRVEVRVGPLPLFDETGHAGVASVE
jgi:hypothetical protein